MFRSIPKKYKTEKLRKRTKVDILREKFQPRPQTQGDPIPQKPNRNYFSTDKDNWDFNGWEEPRVPLNTWRRSNSNTPSVNLNPSLENEKLPLKTYVGSSVVSFSVKRSSARRMSRKKSYHERISKRRQNSKRRSTLRGRNWLKFQLDKRRYEIGFPIGWGSFSVVYFAKAHKFLDAESRNLQNFSFDPFGFGEKDTERQRSHDSEKDLPEFVAVKVIKVKELRDRKSVV